MESIEKLIKLNILYIREMQREDILKIKSYAQYWDNLTNRNSNCTVSMAVQNLKDKIDRNSNIDYLKTEIASLRQEINNSNIKDLRFYNVENPTEQEIKFENLALKRVLYMIDMIPISEAMEIIKQSQTAIKQACQQNRLLNTEKRSKTWFVHIGECKAYWNIEDKKENSLYNNWEY